MRRLRAWLKRHHRHDYRFVGMASYRDWNGPAVRSFGPDERSAFVHRCHCGDYFWTEVGIYDFRRRYAA